MHLFHVIAQFPLDRPFVAYDVDVERHRQREPYDPDGVVTELEHLVEVGALEKRESTWQWEDGDGPGLDATLYKLTPAGQADVEPYRGGQKHSA